MVTMSYRISEVEITQGNPFENDSLEREEMVNFLMNVIIKSNGNPLVVAIDAPYGAGKSTFLRMLDAV